MGESTHLSDTEQMKIHSGRGLSGLSLCCLSMWNDLTSLLWCSVAEVMSRRRVAQLVSSSWLSLSDRDNRSVPRHKAASLWRGSAPPRVRRADQRVPRMLLQMGFLVASMVPTQPLYAEDAHPGVTPLRHVEPAFPRDQDVQLPGMVDVTSVIPDVVVDLKYGSADNFMGVDVYGGLRRCFLAPAAAEKLAKARRWLETRAPGLTFVMWDCARPRRVQRIMWSLVEHTPSRHYVANPNTRTGSIHNYGCAADMSLWDTTTGQPVDMGTPYDYFGKLAEPRHELRFWKEGKLSSEQLANRLLLREVMLRAGFAIIANEWWHFNAFDNQTVRRSFAIIE